MAGKIYVGIGGWTFEPWRGVFYPEGPDPEARAGICRRKLTSIEINGTYYSSFKPASWAKWRDETPDGFVFAVKASRFCTNRRVLAEAGELVAALRRPGPDRARRPARADQLAVHGAPRNSIADDFEAFLNLLPREVGSCRCATPWRCATTASRTAILRSRAQVQCRHRLCR